jgi:hypothetical protein
VTDQVAALVARYANTDSRWESLSVHHAIVTDAALVATSSCFLPTLQRLEFGGCNLLHAEAIIQLWQRLPLLRAFSAWDCSSLAGPALWSHLPHTLVELTLRGLARLTVPSDDDCAGSVLFPQALIALRMRDCPRAELTPTFVAKLPSGLLTFEADNMSPDCAARLPRSLESLWLNSSLTGAELELPRLRSVRLGRSVTDDGLIALSGRSPQLQQLDVSRCPTLENSVALAKALRQLVQLDTLDVRFNAQLDGAAIVDGLQGAGVRLRQLLASMSWFAVPRGLIRVLSLEGLTRLKLSESVPEELMTALPSCPLLTYVAFQDCHSMSEAAWDGLCGAASRLRTLRLLGLTFLTDALLHRVLVSTGALERLSLEMLPLLRGKCLATAKLQNLRRLKLVSCCKDDVSLSKLLETTPLLEQLVLEGIVPLSFVGTLLLLLLFVFGPTVA